MLLINMNPLSKFEFNPKAVVFTIILIILGIKIAEIGIVFLGLFPFFIILAIPLDATRFAPPDFLLPVLPNVSGLENSYKLAYTLPVLVGLMPVGFYLYGRFRYLIIVLILLFGIVVFTVNSAALLNSAHLKKEKYAKAGVTNADQLRETDLRRKLDVGKIGLALSSYYSKNRNYPKQLQDLVSEGFLESLPVPPDGSDSSFYPYERCLYGNNKVDAIVWTRLGKSGNDYVYRTSYGRAEDSRAGYTTCP